MPTVKKLILAPIFLLVFAYTLYQLTPFLKSYDLIFALSLNTLIQVVILSSSILFSAFIFILFATFAADWKYVLPVGLLSALIPLLFLEPALGLVFAVGIIAGLLLSYIGLENSLKTYLTFQPSSLLGPFIRHLSAFLILIICIVYFLSINKVVSEKGFQIPDSLIDTAIKLTSRPQLEQTENPDLLKQSVLSPNSLHTPNELKSESSQASLIKQTIKDQIQTFIKPYLSFVPLILSVLLFLTLQSLISILNLFIYPLLWLIFYILEKSGFITFIVEQRPVKKMVI